MSTYDLIPEDDSAAGPFVWVDTEDLVELNRLHTDPEFVAEMAANTADVLEDDPDADTELRPGDLTALGWSDV